jgi:hypothetical protein
MLKNGQLSKDDYEWLLASKKDLAELVALKRAGLSKVGMDRFTNGVIDTTVSTAFRVLLS